MVYKEISAGSDQMFLEKKRKIRSCWFRNAPSDCQTGFFFFVIKKIDLSIFGYFFSTCDTLYSDNLIQQLQICNQNNLMCRRVAMNSMSWQTFSRKFRHESETISWALSGSKVTAQANEAKRQIFSIFATKLSIWMLKFHSRVT